MLKRLLALGCLVAITTTPLHAQVEAAQEARTLDEVITKYRTDRVMDSLQKMNSVVHDSQGWCLKPIEFTE